MSKNFDDLLSRVKECKRKKVSVAVAQDEPVLEAIKAAKEQGIADAILVGDKNKIKEIADSIGMDITQFEVIHEPDVKKAALFAIQLVSSGRADMVMKGLIDTVSISLNNPHKDEYLSLVRSKFGEQSFDAMLDFAKECTKYIPNVVLTTVDTTISHEEEEECRRICESIGATYRIRPWEE